MDNNTIVTSSYLKLLSQILRILPILEKLCNKIGVSSSQTVPIGMPVTQR
jgi:hypothetical protein